MPRRNPLKSFSLVPVLVLFLSLFLSSTICHGQSPADMPLRQVISEAQALIGKGDFAGASPYLTSWKFVLRMKKILKWKKFFNNSVSFVVLDICKVLLKRKSRFFRKASSLSVFSLKNFQMTQKLLWLYKREQIACVPFMNGKMRLELLNFYLIHPNLTKTNFKKVRIDEFVFWACSMLSYRAGLGKR